MDRRTIGRGGEMKAAEYLRKKKYKILAVGYTSRFGEIDIIAQQKITVVFVEVKLRKNDTFAKAKEFVTVSKQKKLVATAMQWMAERGTECAARFDVIEVYAPFGMDEKNVTIEHIENAFEVRE